MLSFPEDICMNILKRLPTKPLLRFSCVSKSCYKFIKTNEFVKLQLNHSLEYGDAGILYNENDYYGKKITCVDYDSSSLSLSNTVARIDYPLGHTMKLILGSSHGLVCYLSSLKNIIIWNPYTQDYKEIPTPQPPSPEPVVRIQTSYIFRYGYGYDLKTDDYKFARLASMFGQYCEIAVYSLRLNFWQTCRVIPPSSCYQNLVLFEGIFHWVGTPNDYELPRMICSFDVGSEAYKEIPLPHHVSEEGNKLDVLVLGGCLYLALTHCGGNTCNEVWMMKDYGVQESWTKMLSIDGEYLDLKQSFKNGVILLKLNCSDSYLYDVQHKTFTELEINGCRVNSTWDFLGSLVSPNNIPNARGYHTSEIIEAPTLEAPSD